ncbi:hypothetical protein [Actinomadura madurae]|uniref:hypothetical protein n=1 Tax=Actinomadura madurae TaxID=1993 RepID=UPI0020D20A6E|nr:hypothetical protein [Actinomadura madurae]MCQ0005981.1 hypothetical protein [Actinomadura madurae]
MTVLALHPLGERFDGEGGTTAAVQEPAARERPPSDAERLAYSSAELDGHAAGLFFGSTEPAGRPAAGGEPAGYLVQAVVSAPVALPELTGTLRADVSVVRPSRRVEHAHGREPARFALTLPGARTPIASPARPAEKTAPAASGVRLCFAADIERFSRFRTPEAARAQRRFVDLLDDARRHAGLPTAHTDLQRSGDGQFDVLPAALDESRVIPRLIEGLVDALAETNTDLNAHARLRIRAALHRGHVSSGINGWLGESTIAVHRLLDSPPCAVRSPTIRRPTSPSSCPMSSSGTSSHMDTGGWPRTPSTGCRCVFPTKASRKTAGSTCRNREGDRQAGVTDVNRAWVSSRRTAALSPAFSS